MKRTFVGTCLAAALGMAISASAQQPPQPQPQPSQPTPAASASAQDTKAQDTKLTGCLKAGTAAGSFELATSKKDKAAKTGDSAATSTSPQAPAQGAMASDEKKNVKLSPAAGVDLAAHLNHQIEIAGSWDTAAGASSAAGAASKTFNVTSVKMISASCTTGTN